jgi:hypothetical protein
MNKLKSLARELKKKAFTIFGDIRIYKYPLFLLYHPKGYKIRGERFAQIANSIQTYDVLLRRYDTYLDKAFVPGWWNHAAICSNGSGAFSTILHATSDGVNEESLFDFMKTDHVCLLRPDFYIDTQQITKEMQQITGSEYDFDFNFSDPAALSCTEVISYLFRHYNTGIRQQWFLGRQIVPPDNILRAPGFKLIA